RPPAEGRASAPAARAPVPALASNSRLPAGPSSAPGPGRAAADPSIAALLATMRPPPARATGDAYAGAQNSRDGTARERASPPAGRKRGARGLGSPEIQAAGGPAAIGGR